MLGEMKLSSYFIRANSRGCNRYSKCKGNHDEGFIPAIFC
jgi:hypothetical protein